MLTIVLIVVFGVLFSVFATQNTATTTLFFGSYTLPDLPMYLVVLISIGIGVLIVSFYHFLLKLSMSMTLGDKEKEIKDFRREVTELTKEVHKLELENTKLRAKLDEEEFDDESI